MNRYLIVGDVHAKVDDLDDCRHLQELIRTVESTENPDATIFLGDQFDAFALKNVIVERWWMDMLEDGRKRYLLVGNHDRPGDSAAVGNALQAHRDRAVVVDVPVVVGDVALLPFYFCAADFVAACCTPDVLRAKTIFAHQSFLGGRFESGIPIDQRTDPSAVEPGAVPQQCVISGHIHAPQSVGKVWYPGAPRWRNNVSDANCERYIYLVSFDVGVPKGIKKFSTGEVCRRMWRVEDTEGVCEVSDLPGRSTDRFVVDITGTAAYIERQKKKWSSPGVRIRAFQTDRPGPKLSESQGVEAAWNKWMSEYSPKHGSSLEALRRLAIERLSP